MRLSSLVFVVLLCATATSARAQDSGLGQPAQEAPDQTKQENPPEPESHGTRLRWQDIPKNVLHDEKAIFTSPLHINRENARWWIVFGGATAALIASDRKITNTLPQTTAFTTPSRWTSRFGAPYSLFPLWGTFYLVGKAGDNPRARDTGRIGIEALLDTEITVTILKAITQRPRPEIKGESVAFFKGGDAFPSGHSIQAWALARVFAREFPEHKIYSILAYSMASTVSVSRFAGRRHSASDALAGAAMGSSLVISSIVIITPHQKNQKRSPGLPHTRILMYSWALIDRRGGTGSLEVGTRISNDSAAVVSAVDLKQKLTDRVLSGFAPVRHGEGIGALLLAAHVFLLLSAYYILKTVREGLILSEGGAEIKTYSSAAQAALLLLIIPLYSWLSSKMKRDRLLILVTLFFASHLGIFVALAKAGFHIGIAFFLWVGIFNLFVISQFWALANDLYDQDQGKRLLPVVGVGSSLGAWIGSVYASRAFSTFGSSGLMLIAAGLLLGCVAVHRALDRFPQAFRKDGQAIGQKPLNKDGAFRLILNSRYLFWIAILVLVLNVVNTTGEFLLSKLVVSEADRMAATGIISVDQKAEFIGEFYGSFFSWVNLAGMVFQLFLVSRLFKFIGVRGALFVLPSIALVAYGLVAVAPLLAFVRIAKIFENGTDYSIQNTARQALFLVTSREAKYKAKAAIDSFFWRIGDVLAAVLVFVGTQLHFGITTYATFNMALAVVWISIVLIIAREHKKLSAAA